MAFRFHYSLYGGGRMTCQPLPFTCNSIINTHKAVRFLNSLCGGPVCHCHSPLWTHIWRSTSTTHFAVGAAWPVCHFHLPAIMNTHKVFCFLNSLCRGGHVTCLPLPFACNSIINTHMAFRFRNSVCRGGRVACRPLPFTCTSVMNTHKAFRYSNSLS